MPTTETLVTTRWDAQPLPAHNSERLLRLLFGEDTEPETVAR